MPWSQSLLTKFLIFSASVPMSRSSVTAIPSPLLGLNIPLSLTVQLNHHLFNKARGLSSCKSSLPPIQTYSIFLLFLSSSTPRPAMYYLCFIWTLQFTKCACAISWTIFFTLLCISLRARDLGEFAAVSVRVSVHCIVCGRLQYVSVGYQKS